MYKYVREKRESERERVIQQVNWEQAVCVILQLGDEYQAGVSIHAITRLLRNKQDTKISSNITKVWETSF